MLEFSYNILVNLLLYFDICISSKEVSLCLLCNVSASSCQGKRDK